ncbi:hypothetical protein V2G26_006158 [Clonostachys chloroleuca]
MGRAPFSPTEIRSRDRKFNIVALASAWNLLPVHTARFEISAHRAELQIVCLKAFFQLRAQPQTNALSFTRLLLKATGRPGKVHKIAPFSLPLFPPRSVTFRLHPGTTSLPPFPPLDIYLRTDA